MRVPFQPRSLGALRDQKLTRHSSSPKAPGALHFQGGWLGRHLLRPSSEHILIVRAPGAQGMA